MKAETQANSLASLVQKKKKYPEYELALPLFEVKQVRLKKLEVGDVLLVGLSQLDLIMFTEAGICANARVFRNKNTQKIKITYLDKDTLKREHTKKYEILKCSFGRLQSRKLEVGYTLSISKLNLQEVKLFVKGKNIAEGTLVKVDDEIAIQITKVENNAK